MDWGTVAKIGIPLITALGIYAGDQRWDQSNAVTVLQLQSSEICQWKIEELVRMIDKLPPGDPRRVELLQQLAQVKQICGRK